MTNFRSNTDTTIAIIGALAWAMFLNALASIGVGLVVGLLASFVAFLAGWDGRAALMSWWLGACIAWFALETLTTLAQLGNALAKARLKRMVAKALGEE
jgi:hypothetical protein